MNREGKGGEEQQEKGIERRGGIGRHRTIEEREEGGAWGGISGKGGIQIRGRIGGMGRNKKGGLGGMGRNKKVGLEGMGGIRSEDLEGWEGIRRED